MMKLFNTMTKSKEEFKPLRDGEVSMYVCGPTVYNHAHIGNTRPMIVFDVLRRVFEYRHYKVTHVSNFTDIDDKIIKAAKEERMSEKELSQKYIDAYNQVRRDLNLLFPTYCPKVTETMEDIIQFISQLIQAGYAYEKDGDVYFRVSKIEDYGKLSGIRVDDLLEGASNRVEENTKKENPLDFTLWKATNEGVNFESPWSKGRPGWHTECVVMINDLFENGQIDIHGGGQDLKFPHHENEIAQSLALHHHQIANIWMHNQMINIDNVKMSKSLGNVLWAKDMIETMGINNFKWLMLSTHYRNPLNFTQEVVNNVKKEVDKVQSAIKQGGLWLQINEVDLNVVPHQRLEEMVEALEDDLNTSLALTKILEEVKVLNQLLRQGQKDKQSIAKSYVTLNQMLDLMGFDFKVIKLIPSQKELYIKWNELKAKKQFEHADQVRNELIELGVL